jgi:hypothetical protein
MKGNDELGRRQNREVASAVGVVRPSSSTIALSASLGGEWRKSFFALCQALSPESIH